MEGGVWRKHLALHPLVTDAPIVFNIWRYESQRWHRSKRGNIHKSMKIRDKIMTIDVDKDRMIKVNADTRIKDKR